MKPITIDGPCLDLDSNKQTGKKNRGLRQLEIGTQYIIF